MFDRTQDVDHILCYVAHNLMLRRTLDKSTAETTWKVQSWVEEDLPPRYIVWRANFPDKIAVALKIKSTIETTKQLHDKAAWKIQSWV